MACLGWLQPPKAGFRGTSGSGVPGCIWHGERHHSRVALASCPGPAAHPILLDYDLRQARGLGLAAMHGSSQPDQAWFRALLPVSCQRIAAGS